MGDERLPATGVPYVGGQFTPPIEEDRRILVARPIITDPTRITITFKASSQVLWECPQHMRLARLNGLTVCNDGALLSTVRVYIGIYRAVAHDGDYTLWESILPPELTGGAVQTWTGQFYFTPGDQLVSFAETTALAVVGFGIDELSP